VQRHRDVLTTRVYHRQELGVRFIGPIRLKGQRNSASCIWSQFGKTFPR
jgi:hypothetical protein